jgi:hypothetical protein
MDCVFWTCPDPAKPAPFLMGVKLPSRYTLSPYRYNAISLQGGSITIVTRISHGE